MEREKEKRSSTRDHHHKHRQRSSKDESNHHHNRRRHDEEDNISDEEYDNHRHHRRKERERERSEEREGRRDKRKERDGSEEGVDEKRVKGSDGKRERRRFGDKAEDDGENGSRMRREKRETKRVEDGDDAHGGLANDGDVGSHHVSSRPAYETIPSNNIPATKVSSISTTNENKGVNITGSHEVTAKSSTDGAPSTTNNAVGKSAKLSLDALAKAKRTLKIQKELNEKLKKLSALNKNPTASSVASPQSGSKDVGKAAPASLTAVGMSASMSATASAVRPLGAIDPSKIEAVKRAHEVAAKMGFRQDPEFSPLINLFPGQLPADVSVVQKPAKAPVLRLDALGREIDEHGNVVNISKPSNLSTLKVNINKQKKDAFQIQKPELEVDPEKNPHFDERMGINKNQIVRPKRMSFQFVEEGKWSKDAEIIKLKNQFGEAQAKELKAKQAQLAKAKAEPNINPNLIEVSERVTTKEKEKPKEPVPEVEWWDVPLLRSGNYSGITDGENIEDKLKKEKFTIYVEHPRPIEPPAEPAPPPPQPLMLTKKEHKKHQKQRRLAKEKDKQEMIRQGLIEPPKPKIKMSNIMSVLGSEAVQDPTKLEMEVRAAAAEREQAHVDRNIARKLTPSERREKKERKLFDDPNTLETIVSVYKINDILQPKNRFKVDANAGENQLSGCAVMSNDGCVVVVEGGNKSIKRYQKLMLHRIKWDEKLENEDGDDDEDEEKPTIRCVLVWQGCVARRSFNRFSIHDCRTDAAARKVFIDAGVGHYWDLAANYSDDQF